MIKEKHVAFINKKLKKEFDNLKSKRVEDLKLYNFINKAMDELKINPTAGTKVDGGGALIASSTHIVASAKDGILITVGTAALTAGVFRVFVSGVQS